jgi:hypothetical protein
VLGIENERYLPTLLPNNGRRSHPPTFHSIEGVFGRWIIAAVINSESSIWYKRSGSFCSISVAQYRSQNGNPF